MNISKLGSKRKQILSIIIGIIGITLLIGGISYGFWRFTEGQVDQNLVTSDCFKINFEETENTDIQLMEAYPMNEEEKEEFFKTTKPYHFKVTNICDNYASATINLETFDAKEGEKKLDDQWIDVMLYDGEEDIKNDPPILSSQDLKLTTNGDNTKNKVIEEATKAYSLYHFTLRGQETKEFNMFLFMDEETPATDENMNATWRGKVAVTVEYARMYYVAESGSDETGDGTYNNPYKTINKAYQEVPSGGIISLLSDIKPVNKINLDEEGKEVVITSHLTSKKQIYEVQRDTSLTNSEMVRIDHNNNVRLENITFSGLELESNESLIIASNNSTLNLETGSVVEKAKNIKNSGGGIDISSSTLNINGGIVRNNSSTNKGGGIQVANGSTLILNEGEIVNNEAQYGGGIGIYGGASNTFIMKGGKVSNNKVLNTTGVNGGGIHVATDGYNGSKIKIEGGTISGNTSTGQGAGIGISQNCGEITIEITGGEIKDNTASGLGGGMYLANGIETKLTISGGTFSNNTAGTNGGALWLGDDSKDGSSTNEITGGIFDNNHANYGGGMYLLTKKNNVSETKISNAIITNNHAISGGGMYIQSNMNNVTYKLDNVKVENNFSEKKETTNGVGGGIRFNTNATTIENAKTRPLIISNSSISNNQTTDAGGGIYSTGKIVLESGQINKNKATGYGGGIVLITLNIFEMNGGEISENTAGGSGGGVYSYNSVAGSLYEFNDGVISNNVAQTSGGGLEYHGNSTSQSAIIKLKGTDFINNTSETFGGGINIDPMNEKIEFEMSVGNIENNHAKSGGGLYINNSENTVENIYNITGGTIANNVATEVDNQNGVGGGIRFNGSEKNILNLKNVEIANNEAQAAGGGIYTGPGTLNIDSGTMIVGNKSIRVGGGGLFQQANSNGTINFNNGIIKDNTSDANGGGVHIDTGSNFKMSGGSIINNVCNKDNCAGGIHVVSGATYEKTGGIINGNKPKDLD